MALSEEQLKAVAAKLGPPRGAGAPRAVVDVDAVRQLIALGYSRAQIGEAFGCSRETIRRRLNGN
jgi:DNA invertase Pin-like site-specific DNA recombinase